MTAFFPKLIRFFNSHLPWILLMILIFIQSESSADNFSPKIPFFDKITHFLVFGTLAWLIVRAIFKEENTFLQQNYFWIVLIVLALFSLTDEFHQIYTPGRSTDMWDWVADMSGGFVFLYIFKRKNKINKSGLSQTH